MYQLNKMFVHFWLIFTIASFVYACYMVWATSWDEASANFFIPAISLFWWFTRRSMMKRMEKNFRNRQQQ